MCQNSESGITTVLQDEFSQELVLHDGEFYGTDLGIFKYNFFTNSQDYLEFNDVDFYGSFSLTEDKIYVKQIVQDGTDFIFEMDRDGSNKRTILDYFFIENNSSNYRGLFAFENSTLSVKDLNFNDIKLLTNPIEETLKITSNLLNIKAYSIFLLNGSLVKEGILKSSKSEYQIDVKDLTPGIYLLELEINNIKKTKKFIKK